MIILPKKMGILNIRNEVLNSNLIMHIKMKNLWFLFNILWNLKNRSQNILVKLVLKF